MNKPKVYHIISRLNIGGPTKLLISLADQCPKDFEMVVITGQEIENEGELKPNCTIIQINGLEPGSSKKQTWIAYRQIKKILLSEKPDIVHTHQAKAGFLGRVAAYRTKVKVRIHTFHGHVFRGYFSSFKSKAIQTIEKYLAKITTHIIVISKSIEKDIVETYKITTQEKTHLINIGISAFHPTSTNIETNKTKYKLPQNKRIYAFIGRLAPIKNPQLFLAIAKDLAKNTHLHFLLVGNGPLKSECDEFIKKNQLEDNMTSLNWVHDIDNLLTTIDGLIMTSLNEGTPLMALEAMQANVPVLSTPVGGVVDIIQHFENGFLCKEKEDFIQIINQIQTNEIDLLKLKNKAKADIANKFSEKIFYQNTLNMYKESLKIQSQ